jgi:hypothetical protein
MNGKTTYKSQLHAMECPQLPLGTEQLEYKKFPGRVSGMTTSTRWGYKLSYNNWFSRLTVLRSHYWFMSYGGDPGMELTIFMLLVGEYMLSTSFHWLSKRIKNSRSVLLCSFSYGPKSWPWERHICSSIYSLQLLPNYPFESLWVSSMSEVLRLWSNRRRTV